VNDFNKAPKDFATPQELSHDDIAHRAILEELDMVAAGKGGSSRG